MEILLWIVVGLVAGSLAKWAMDGPAAGGLAVAIPLGIGGALIGGWLGSVYSAGTTGVAVDSLLLATFGSLIVLIGYRAYAMRCEA